MDLQLFYLILSWNVWKQSLNETYHCTVYCENTKLIFAGVTEKIIVRLQQILNNFIHVKPHFFLKWNKCFMEWMCQLPETANILKHFGQSEKWSQCVSQLTKAHNTENIDIIMISHLPIKHLNSYQEQSVYPFLSWFLSLSGKVFICHL